MKAIAERLTLLVLEHLPAEPNGLSVAELADGLAENAGPAGRSKISAALGELDRFFGGLSVRRGNDFLGHFDVELYGLPWEVWSTVSRVWKADGAKSARELSTYRTSGDSRRPDGGDLQE